MYAKYHIHHAFSWSITDQYQLLCVQVNCHSGVGATDAVVIVLMAPFVDVVAGLLSAGHVVLPRI